MLTEKRKFDRNLLSRWRLSDWNSVLDAVIQKALSLSLLKTKLKTFVKFQVRGTVLSL